MIKHRAEIAHVESALQGSEIELLGLILISQSPALNQRPTVECGNKVHYFVFGRNKFPACGLSGVPREGTSNGQTITGFNRQNAFAWRFILVKGKPMKKAAVVLSAAAVIAVTTVSIATPVEARGGRGWGPGIAGGLIAGALIGGLASSAYGYGPGYGYYGPGYGYYGGDAPVYYGGYGSTYYGGYGDPYYGGYGRNRFKNWGG